MDKNMDNIVGTGLVQRFIGFFFSKIWVPFSRAPTTRLEFRDTLYGSFFCLHNPDLPLIYVNSKP